MREKVADLTKLQDAWLAEMPNPIKSGAKRYGMEPPPGSTPKKDKKASKKKAAKNPSAL